MARYRTTLILLASLLVLVIAWMLLRNNPSITAEATPTPVATTYVWQEPGTVNSIDVISGTTTVSVRQDLSTTIWSIVAPIQATADPYQVGSPADSLKNLVSIAVLTNTTDLKQYGLDKPTMTIKFSTAGTSPASHTIDVGVRTVDQAGYYVRPDGKDTVYIISTGVVDPLKAWIDKPPKAEPTATPEPTLSPSPAASTTVTATGTITLTLPAASPTP